MLTQDDVKTLTGYFEASEHEFLQGNAYIKEWAVCDRIEQVDPAWSFEVLDIITRVTSVTVKARMTIKGVSRENTGTNTITYVGEGPKDKRTLKLDLNGNPIEANEAEKSATTDALKRCARLFGVGRYLLNLPDGVKDERTMTAWINQQTGKVTPINTPLANSKSRRVETANNGKVERGLLATKIEYKVNGNNKFLVFPDAKNAPVLYTRQPLRDLGETWSEFADKLQPGKVDLPAFLLLTTEAKAHTETGEIYHVVTDIELAEAN